MLTDAFEGNLPVYSRLIFLTTGSKSTTNHGLKRSAADLVCGTADECRDTSSNFCTNKEVKKKTMDADTTTAVAFPSKTGHGAWFFAQRTRCSLPCRRP